MELDVALAVRSLQGFPCLALSHRQATEADLVVKDSLELVVGSHQHSEELVHNQEPGLEGLHRMADADTVPAEFVGGTARSLHQGQDVLHLPAAVHLTLNLRLLQNHKLGLRMCASFDLQQLGLAGPAQGMSVLHSPVVHPHIALADIGLDLDVHMGDNQPEVQPCRKLFEPFGDLRRLLDGFHAPA